MFSYINKKTAQEYLNIACFIVSCFLPGKSLKIPFVKVLVSGISQISNRFFFTKPLVFVLLFTSLGFALETKVEISGVEGAVKKNVFAFLSISKLSKPVSEEELIRLYEKGPYEIREALKPFGYYDPKIESSLEKKNETFNIVYGVEPGAPVLIEEVDIKVSGEGASDAALSQIVFPLQAGEILLHKPYEVYKFKILETALEKGYLDAKFVKHQIRIDLENKEAYIILDLNTGKKYRFGEIFFKGNVLNDSLIRRYSTFQPNDPYSQTALQKFQSRLLSSKYFKDADVTPLREQVKDYQIPVDVTLYPRKSNQYLFGIGYGTDFGIRGSLGWENIRLNRKGHSLYFEVKSNEIEQEMQFRYKIPLKDPETDLFIWDIGWNQEEFDDKETEQWTSGFAVTFSGKWNRSYFLNFREERFLIGDQEEKTTLIFPGANWVRGFSNDRVYPTKGYLLQTRLTGTPSFTGSDLSFGQVYLLTKFVRGIGTKNRILFRFETGATWVEEFERFPLSFRFFAGGDQSIRGYPYKSISPEDGEGNPVGGKYLFVASFEYEYRIIDKLGLALFYDSGNAADDFLNEFKSGTGLGFRYFSPIGTIRLDLANALNKEDNPWRVHFSIGLDL